LRATLSFFPAGCARRWRRIRVAGRSSTEGVAGGALHRQVPSVTSSPALTPQMTIAGSSDSGSYGCLAMILTDAHRHDDPGNRRQRRVPGSNEGRTMATQKRRQSQPRDPRPSCEGKRFDSPSFSGRGDCVLTSLLMGAPPGAAPVHPKRRLRFCADDAGVFDGGSRQTAMAAHWHKRRDTRMV